VTPAADLFARLLHPLQRAGIPYMVTGGLAAIIYGDPRLTNDVDVVVQLNPDDAERLAAAFAAPGWYVPPVEVIREEAARVAHGHFNLLELDTSLRADVYCLGADPLGTWAMAHRQRIELSGGPVWIAPIEYVILQKLRYFREGGGDRHLRDIAAIRRISGALIDQPTLDAWVHRLGLTREWERAAAAS
jgi:hypothetical protein